MNKSVFLDRDGTLIKNLKPRMVNTRFGRVLNDCVIRPSEIKFCPGVVTGLKRLQAKGYKLIVVTNQSVVARGVITEAQLKRIHRCLVSLLVNQGIRISGIYYCPHHPTEARIKKYLRRCKCRKPEPGLIRRAAKLHKISIKQSFLIGDSQKDVQSGKKAGLKCIRIDHKTRFLSAIKKILNNKDN